MSTAEKRQTLHQRIDEIDDKFLNAIYAMVEAYLEDENRIVGYEPNGDPITLSALKARIKISEEQYEKGQYITVEELDKRSQEWLNRTR